MKKLLPFLLYFFILSSGANAQITTPVIKANFGVDADLRSNFFNGALQAGNDDWFRLPGIGGTGEFVIDTTGAAALVARYAADPNSRKLPFYRTMRFNPYTVVNNRLLIDAVFTRDYHGDDSTMFASGSNKNGMSPVSWSCPVAQSVPDKNEILDMMCHVRRAGPNTTDSLWLIGGVSIENTTGNRYFDFEMYQTDIYYDRGTQRFYGYGPDAGHTSWKFDAAGNITQPGDIIFTAEYSSSSLTLVEARIWVKKTDWQTISPTGFSWSGLFDGDGSGATYGYASIMPKTAGAFYTGLQSVNNTWAGPFSLVLGDNSVATNYIARQFMEFSVNLTKLGLDPVTLLGGNACGMPFRRVLVKSRASTSFTAELKDFIGPFDFFLAPKANVTTSTPYLCDTGSVSNLYVTNPVSSSTYIWSTINGNISGSNNGTSINVTSPGTYIVTQYLQSGCSAYATDTLQVLPFSGCVTLQNNLTDFSGSLDKSFTKLKWAVQENSYVTSFELEKSYDGIHFIKLTKIDPKSGSSRILYSYDDNIENVVTGNLFYRLKINEISGVQKYSKIVTIPLFNKNPLGLSVMPNPAKDFIQVSMYSTGNSTGQVLIYDPAGRISKTKKVHLQKGTNSIIIDNIDQYPPGTYLLVLNCNHESISRKFIVIK
jgi:hypothetical protein